VNKNPIEKQKPNLKAHCRSWIKRTALVRKDISQTMSETREALTVDQLMDLSEEDAIRLRECNLPNSDEDTDDEKWLQNAKDGIDGFMNSQQVILNLLLGRK
jgi:hypothetical protein